MDEIKQIPTVQEFYKDRPNAQLICLRSIRPHTGLWLEENEKGDYEDRAAAMNAFSTSGIDALIVIARLLMSFGYSRPENPTEEVAALLLVAEKNLGFDEDEDRKLKRYLASKINNKESFSPSDTIPSFIDLCNQPSLQGIICDHPDFRLYHEDLVFELEETEDGEEKERDIPPTIMDWDGMEELEKVYWDSHWPKVEEGDTPMLYTTNRPEFLIVDYTSLGLVTFESIRRIDFRAPEASKDEEGLVKFGTYTSKYQLCAVVRLDKLSSGTAPEDTVRIYAKDGLELQQSEVGNFQAKAPPNKIWSVADAGHFALFYFRVEQAHSNGREDGAAEENDDDDQFMKDANETEY